MVDLVAGTVEFAGEDTQAKRPAKGAWHSGGQAMQEEPGLSEDLGAGAHG